MKTWKQIFLLAAILCVCSGCTTISPVLHDSEPDSANFSLGDSMISAMRTRDYTDFVKNFSKDLKDSITKAAFQKLCDDLSDKQEKIESWKLLDTLDRGGLYHTEVWKVTFLRSGKKEQVRVDRLFYVTRAKLDDRIVVIGFRSDPLF